MKVKTKPQSLDALLRAAEEERDDLAIKLRNERRRVADLEATITCLRGPSLAGELVGNAAAAADRFFRTRASRG